MADAKQVETNRDRSGRDLHRTGAGRTGDVFVIYTDGVVESRSQAGEEFGNERLMEAVCRHNGKPVSDLHAALLGDLNRFLGEKAYDDDMTLLVLRWDGKETDGNKAAYAGATEQLIPNQDE